MGKDAQQQYALSAEARAELEELMARPDTPRRLAERARILWLGADGSSAKSVAQRLGLTALTVGKWRRRYRAAGLSGLTDLRRPGQPRKLSPARRAEILRLTVHTIPDGGTRWSIRQMASVAGVTQHQVRQIWREAGLTPGLAAEASSESHPRWPPRELCAVAMDARCALAIFRPLHGISVSDLAPSDPLPRSREQPKPRAGSEAVLYRSFRLAMRAASAESSAELSLRALAASSPRPESLYFLVCGSPAASDASTPFGAAAQTARVPTAADWLRCVEEYCSAARARAEAPAREVVDFRNALDAYVRRSRAANAPRPFHWLAPSANDATTTSGKTSDDPY